MNPIDILVPTQKETVPTVEEIVKSVLSKEMGNIQNLNLAEVKKLECNMRDFVSSSLETFSKNHEQPKSEETEEPEESEENEN